MIDQKMIFFCYKSIPLALTPRKDYAWKNAKRYTINGTNQNVWIPNKHLDNAGQLKPHENIDYVFRPAQRQLNIAGISWAIPGVKRKDSNANRPADAARAHRPVGP